RDDGFHHDIGLAVRQILHAPYSDRAATLRRHFEGAGVLGCGNPRDVGVAHRPPRVVDGLEAFDDYPAVERFHRAELADADARQTDSRDARMPAQVERPD